jgi:hypothetical protein
MGLQNNNNPKLRVMGQNEIWVQALSPCIENIVKVKVVASPKSMIL